MTMTANLTKPERAQLLQLEDVLTTARRWAVEEAKAIFAIRDRRLYRVTHATFESYGAERWGFDRAHLYRLSAWGEVITKMSHFGDIPQRESHARPLYGLPADQQRKIWGEVQKRLGGSRTADAIAAVVRDCLDQHRVQPPARHNVRTSGVVVCGDAIEQVAQLDAKSVGMVLFSPPYCEQRRGQYPGIAEAHFPGWLARLMTAMKPVLMPDASVMIVGREHVRGGTITDAWLRARLAIRAAGFKEIDVLTWHKPDAPPLGRVDRPRRVYESVYWFSLTADPYVDLTACGKISDRLGWRGGRDSRHHTTNVKAERTGVARVTDVVVAPVAEIDTDHPAPFPPSLANQLIRTYSRPGDLVADCCCGSGTTLVAARDAGRCWWGCDIVPVYVRLAQQQL